MNTIQITAKINSIFLAVILVIGTFAVVYPSFIIGIQAQSEYEEDYGYDKSNNNYNYKSAEHPPVEYPPVEYETDRYNAPEYLSPSYEYPKSEYPQNEYESNQENDFYNYPPTESIYPDIVVPIDFPTIQDALNTANEGDVIKVLPGTYTEQLTISNNITIIGSGAKSTIIEAPPLEELELNVIGLPYIVEVNNGAEVTITGFTIKGPQGTDCGELIGVSVIEDGTINLQHAVIKGCTLNSVAVGFEETGHATITKTFITDYREHGVFAIGPNTTLTMSYNKVLGSAPDALAITGILFVFNATGTITNNEVSKNICDIPNTCGPDWFNQFQAFGIVADSAGEGSVIANNYVTNNDAGIGVFGASGCCIVDYNKLKDNRFFGVIIGDSEHIVSNSKIFGGQIGAAAIATFDNTTAILDQVKIVGAEIPIQSLSSGNLTAAINVLSPSFFQP
ncbi:MAG: right-handed parallel beta-helix repeat-containing protein [Nitrososphaeraceae archaeon]